MRHAKRPPRCHFRMTHALTENGTTVKRERHAEVNSNASSCGRPARLRNRSRLRGRRWSGRRVHLCECMQPGQPGRGRLAGKPCAGQLLPARARPLGPKPSTAVTAVRIKARTENPSAAFSVYANTSLIINTLTGSGQIPRGLDGVYSVPPGGTLQIRNADAVNWEVTAVSVEAPSNPARRCFTKTGTGDTVFLLPARPAKYRIHE